MKKVFLHIGFHKTASSSFQATCANNSNLLTLQNYHFPLFNCLANDAHSRIQNHSVPILSSFTEQPHKLRVNIEWRVGRDLEAMNRAYLEQLDECLLSDKDLILSGEGISHLSAQRLSVFVKHLRKFNVKIVPFACIRSPYAFHCSALQQVIKDGGSAHFTSLQSQKKKLLKVEKVFGESFTFIPFAETCRHLLGPAGYLLQLCGVDITKFEFVKVNEGASNGATRLQGAMNNLQPKIVDGKLNSRHVRVPPVCGDKFLLTRDELALIRKDLDDENAFFRKYLGNEFVDQAFPVSDHFTADNLVELYPKLFFSDVGKLSNQTVDYLRDQAIKNEDSLNIAYELMKLAYASRPTGPLIRKKLEAYRLRLKIGGNNRTVE